MSKINLLEFGKRIYSEYTQDGVLEKIFNTIGITNKYFVELGSNGSEDGKGNTVHLRKTFGFDGLLVDAGDFKNTQYNLQKEFISAENINEILEKYNTPNSFDFLGIDIDGEDYYVMQSIDLNKFQPRVVSIEFNTAIMPSNLWVQKHQTNWIWDGWHFYGCSLGAITNLMNKLDYSLVCVCGCDAIFISNKENVILFEDVNDVETLYKNGARLPQEDLLSLSELLKSSQFFISV